MVSFRFIRQLAIAVGLLTATGCGGGEKVEEEESKETNVYVPPGADKNCEIEGGEVVHTLLPGI